MTATTTARDAGGSDWNYGDILDALDASFPGDAPALIHGDRIVPWSDLGRRTNNLARRMREGGPETGDKVALYMRNGTEYMETVAACFKARMVHVNVNFRYLEDELLYILDNSDARTIIYSAEFADRIEVLRDRLPSVVHFVEVGSDSPAAGSVSYESWAEGGDGKPLGIERSGEDLLFVYTGGTTGMPKGVMWAHSDLWGALGAGDSVPANQGENPPTMARHVENVCAFGPSAKQIPACPLMHGTGLFTAITTLTGGGCVVTLESPGFDAAELFETIQKHEVNSIVIVGDAFAKPMLNTLEENPGRFDLSALKVVISSGVMFSRDVKHGLLKHHAGMMLVDAFGSSEAVGFGTSVTTAAGEVGTGRFQIGPKCKVFTEDHTEVLPGSPERGFIARCGAIPRGYYKDEKKSAATFPVIDGVRYSIPGDWCTVEADGTLTLLGRGSVCINTAGEKVHPEEVEEALKTHETIEDALVVGLPDEKWGQAVTAVVQVAGGSAFDEEGLRQFVRESLAGYKTPKRIVAVEKMFRAPNGKADYKSATAYLEEQLGA